MKPQGQAPKEIRFGNPRLNAVGIELLHLSELGRRVSMRHLATPERAEFFMLLLVTAGTLHHTLDFAVLQLHADSLLFVHPGQVQQWHLDPPVQGCMVMVDPPALLPARDARGHRDTLLTAMEDWPSSTQLGPAAASEMQQAFNRLEMDLSAYDGSAEDTMLIRMVLIGILLRLARWHRVDRQRSGLSDVRPRDPRDVHRLFRRELEQRFREQPTVADFARRLGFSESTLNRACQAATGQTAKVLVDRRVALEAARLLAHSGVTVAGVGHGLGFSEPTNFVRFFVRMIGTTPARFRIQHRRGAMPD